MAEPYAPPTGPPPPKVPEGWKVLWNDQYSEWFFVNIYTKRSQWEKPTEPVYPPGEVPLDAPPGYAPPSSGAAINVTGASDKSGLSSNNPYASVPDAKAQAKPDLSEDEKLARKLQEEENAKVGGSRAPSGDERGAASDYYNQPGQAQSGQYGGGAYPQQSYPQGQQTYPDTTVQEKGKGKGGLLGKIMGKVGGSHSSSSSSQQQYGYGQPGYPQQQYSGAPGGYYGGGYQQHAQAVPGKKPGIGKAGLAAGAGAGLLGGALIGGALADAGHHGYGDGGDYGGDGGDFGGDGGDFGGGGGDFGGGF